MSQGGCSSASDSHFAGGPGVQWAATIGGGVLHSDGTLNFRRLQRELTQVERQLFAASSGCSRRDAVALAASQQDLQQDSSSRANHSQRSSEDQLPRMLASPARSSLSLVDVSASAPPRRSREFDVCSDGLWSFGPHSPANVGAASSGGSSRAAAIATSATPHAADIRGPPPLPWPPTKTVGGSSWPPSEEAASPRPPPVPQRIDEIEDVLTLLRRAPAYFR